MPAATFRFYADLNSFLPYAQRQADITYEFVARASVKDMIEALGIPHTEVDLLLVNGEPVDFGYVVRPGDRISVYPPFSTLDIASVTRVRPPAPPEPRFVLDVHLGKLATYLRLMGFDALFPENYDDANLARISEEEQRIMLTRDRGLLKRSNVTHGYCLRSTNSRRQLVEVLRRYDLASAIQPFTRCLRCNGRLEPVPKSAILDQLEPGTREHYDDFRQCQTCGQIYWQGAHFMRLEAFVRDALYNGDQAQYAARDNQSSG
ncbi:MAG: Mut7-C ubiquitin/RNAse domain-containing protein [Anaerolineae bacterium]|nr:Mut7-C ubiquitin/RNAse domain-containing protein [Anaerolineae bacterium]